MQNMYSKVEIKLLKIILWVVLKFITQTYRALGIIVTIVDRKGHINSTLYKTMFTISQEVKLDMSLCLNSE